MTSYKPTYLMHHGVKGMKWGVRHEPDRNPRTVGSKMNAGEKTVTRFGFKKQNSTDRHNAVYKHKKAIRRILIGTAAVSTAAVVGVEAYKYGLMKSDRILKAGTKVQNIAPPGRDFNIPFYGVHDASDMKYYAKHFTTKDTPEKVGRNIATYLTNAKDVKIAGKKSMDRAYRKAYGNNPIKREIFYRRLGGLKPNQKARFFNELHKEGYSGFKDINDMQFLFGGNTPTVYFGKASGFSPSSSVKVDVKKARRIRTLTGVGKRTLIESGAIAAGTASAYGAHKVNKMKRKRRRKSSNG